MVKVLFVCHGNICRSPMAEFVLKDMVQKAGISHRVHIASAAVSTEERGNPMYPPAARELDRHGIPYERRRARQITQEDVQEYHRIFYMDQSNARYLARMFPSETKFEPFLDRSVADPWYTGDFTQTWLDIWEGCQKILEQIKE